MSDLVVGREGGLRLDVLPPTSPELLEALDGWQRVSMRMPQIAVRTEHLLHAGMYARTIFVPAEMIVTGVRIKVETLVIVSGRCAVLGNDGWVELAGYNVIRGSAGRKQIFVTREPVQITMVFPTQARTVEDAEREFTDEVDALLSRRQDANTVVITEE